MAGKERLAGDEDWISALWMEGERMLAVEEVSAEKVSTRDEVLTREVSLADMASINELQLIFKKKNMRELTKLFNNIIFLTKEGYTLGRHCVLRWGDNIYITLLKK